MRNGQGSVSGELLKWENGGGGGGISQKPILR
jgi:hypothetical protein